MSTCQCHRKENVDKGTRRFDELTVHLPGTSPAVLSAITKLNSTRWRMLKQTQTRYIRSTARNGNPSRSHAHPSVRSRSIGHTCNPCSSYPLPAAPKPRLKRRRTAFPVTRAPSLHSHQVGGSGVGANPLLAVASPPSCSLLAPTSPPGAVSFPSATRSSSPPQ